MPVIEHNKRVVTCYMDTGGPLGGIAAVVHFSSACVSLTT